MATLPQATLMPWMEGDNWISALNLIGSIDDDNNIVVICGLIAPLFKIIPLPFFFVFGIILEIVAFIYNLGFV